ncbi:MAG: microcin C transport system ATP-binding protein [Gammaproteobacteria bacterium]|jgi:microcin C transport system ATP-binding protein
MTTPLISVENLSIAFGRSSNTSQVVHNISFSIPDRDTIAIVGESGSGKTVTALSLLNLHDPYNVHFPSGKIMYQGKDILSQTEDQLRNIRGKDIAMIFQEPMNSLNPVYTIGEQLIEPLILHLDYSREKSRKYMLELLDRTGIINPHKRFDDYPHMLSGGQRQRVMIAMALACNPKLLIADEPSTALDVTIEAQILDLIKDLQKEFEMAVLLITHDLGIVKKFARHTIVMQDGIIVEQGESKSIFSTPNHQYTKHLLASQPERLVDNDETKNAKKLLSAKNIRCYFPIKEGFFKRTVDYVKAVDDVTLEIAERETVGIVGESGSGKTTLGKCLLRLQSCEGSILFNNVDIVDISPGALRKIRSDIQVVFQDPFASLSPRLTIQQILMEGLRIHFKDLDRQQQLDKCYKVLEEVDLEKNILTRYPHEFSGGQRQRIAVARVLLLEPKLIVLDEPTSALDVSVQKQVLGLLRNLQLKHGISYLFISHDLKVIRAMSHKVWVMKNGQIVEKGNTQDIFDNPKHPYTQELLNAALHYQ